MAIAIRLDLWTGGTLHNCDPLQWVCLKQAVCGVVFAFLHNYACRLCT